MVNKYLFYCLFGLGILVGTALVFGQDAYIELISLYIQNLPTAAKVIAIIISAGIYLMFDPILGFWEDFLFWVNKKLFIKKLKRDGYEVSGLIATKDDIKYNIKEDDSLGLKFKLEVDQK